MTGLEHHRARLARAVEERNAKMGKMRADGLTLAEIGRVFGISRERVRQVLAEREREDEREATAALRGWLGGNHAR